MHTNGGCSSVALSHDHGFRITSLLEASRTLQQVTGGRKLKFTDVPPLLKPLLYQSKLALKPPLDLRIPKVISDGGTLKHIDDVKGAGLDKQFSDRRFTGPLVGSRLRMGRRSQLTRGASARTPFILSTSHHSTAWAARETGSDELSELACALEQKSAELEALGAEYQNVLAELEELAAAYDEVAEGQA